MGGLLTSCGEENLLKLEKDHYNGRDICVHEFSHSIRNYGIPRDVRARFDEQYKNSLAKGLWEKSYAGSNPDEFFAELTMWYFGTHGDLHMTGPKPENGPEGLKKYDPEAYALLDDFYSGRIKIPKVEPRRRFRREENGTIGPATNAPSATQEQK
jgi:alpha-glucosidase